MVASSEDLGVIDNVPLALTFYWQRPEVLMRRGTLQDLRIAHSAGDVEQRGWPDHRIVVYRKRSSIWNRLSFAVDVHIGKDSSTPWQHLRLPAP